MTSDPVRAGPGWLQLREPADAEARSGELVDILRSRLPTGALEIHDLGAGTGSMARWLAPRLEGRQRWVLHDRDAGLLRLADRLPVPRSRDGAAVTLQTRVDDITGPDAGELAAASLITASALLDMFTAGGQPGPRRPAGPGRTVSGRGPPGVRSPTFPRHLS